MKILLPLKIFCRDNMNTETYYFAVTYPFTHMRADVCL